LKDVSIFFNQEYRSGHAQVVWNNNGYRSFTGTQEVKEFYFHIYPFISFPFILFLLLKNTSILLDFF
jgi:hypothetical protein